MRSAVGGPAEGSAPWLAEAEVGPVAAYWVLAAVGGQLAVAALVAEKRLEEGQSLSVVADGQLAVAGAQTAAAELAEGE